MSNSFELAQIFSDNMILQRDTNLTIWGLALDGSQVKVEFCGQNKVTTVVNGEWSVTLLPVSAGGPFEMKVRNGVNEIVLRNILVGEVWVAGGQSNMEHPLLLTIDVKSEILAADYPNIRFYTVPRRPFEDAVIDGWHFKHTVSSQAVWEVCSPENAGLFSAVAFHFAKGIQTTLNVPVGVIECNWGGTSAACWMNEKYLSDTELNVYLKEYNDYASKLDRNDYEKQFTQYLNDLKKFAETQKRVPINPDKVDDYLMDTSAGPLPGPPLGPKSFLRPSGLYYTMLKKIIPYAVKGVIWYQGESDTHRPLLYRKLFSEMIRNWRTDWNNTELPFLFVQLSSFDGDWMKKNSWAELRESQLFVAKNVKNTAMAVVIDCGDKTNIHPSNKRPVGERLVLVARDKVYGQDIVSSGPIYREMKVKGSKVILYFDHIGKGLVIKGEIFIGFEICGQDNKFVEAKAEIIDNTVEVYNSDVEHPIAVRYGWANFIDVNLFNVDGLPTSPFRTGSNNDSKMGD